VKSCYKPHVKVFKTSIKIMNFQSELRVKKYLSVILDEFECKLKPLGLVIYRPHRTEYNLLTYNNKKDYIGCGKLTSFFHIAIKKPVVKISFQFFFSTKGTHLKLWFTSF
jgi:hypothetical protein